MLLKEFIFVLFFFLISIKCATNVPVWTVYSQMYSGQHDPTNTTKLAGSSFTCQRQLYMSGSGMSYSTPPKLILSLMGYAQDTPPNGDVSVGFDVNIININQVNFTTQHNVYGADLFYISYMFLGIAQSFTQFYVGQYTQIMASSNQSIDILNNVGQTYSNYRTHLIQMKGFLSGYKLKQKTTGTCIYFSLAPKNQTAFTITISTQNDVVIQQIWYYRIAYDRTSLQRKTFNDVFFQFKFQLKNGTNIYSSDLVTCANQNCFQYGYRNFLMGTNKINIGSFGRTQFYLQYYFSTTKSGSNPFTQANPSNAIYLQGQVFLHMIQTCSNPSTPYFLDSNLLCNTACPLTNYYTNSTSKTCQLCHYSCLTCLLPFLQNQCLSCDTSKRLALNNNSQCLCSLSTYDDGSNLQCKNCDLSCLSCNSGTQYDCISCNSSLNRQFNDTDLNGIGNCICQNGYYQNISNIGGLCLSCKVGCLDCFYSSIQICRLCDTSNHWILDSNLSNCICQTNYYQNGLICTAQVCGDGIFTFNQECDDNNLINGDGCSNLCKIQIDHSCILNSTISSYSICYYNKQLGLTITEVIKSPYSNSVNLKILVSANNCNEYFLNKYLTQNSSLQLLDKARLLFNIQNFDIEKQDKTNNSLHNKKPDFSVFATSVQLTITSIYYSSAQNILYITFQYDQTFSLQKKTIRFIPSSSIMTPSKKYFYQTPTASVNLQPAYNKVQTIYFNNSDYQSVIILRWAYFILLILYWIVCILFIGMKKSNVSAQLMIVLQLSYLCLLSQSSIQIGFGGLAQYGKHTIGINLNLQKNNSVCRNFLALNLNCSLLNNINISSFFIFFVIVLIISLKLYQKLKNYIAFKSFLQEKQQKQLKKYIQSNNSQRQGDLSQQRSNSNGSDSSSQQIFFKQQFFVQPIIYQYLTQVLYFGVFITVMIWGVSLCYIKQQAGGSIGIALSTGFMYLGVWVYWFSKYHDMKISFTSSNNQLVNQNENQDKQKISTSKIKFSPKILKILYYPFIWVSVLSLSFVLALSQPIGYLCQSLVISFTSFIAVLIWIFKFYTLKFQNLRALLNCVFIVLVQIIYIISQAGNSIVDAGIIVSSLVFTILCTALITNFCIQCYLFTLQLKEKRKQQRQDQINEIVQQIQIIKQNKKKIEEQNVSEYKSTRSKNIKSPLLDSKTVKKNPVFQEQQPQQEQQLKQNIKLNKKKLQQLLKTKRIQSNTDRGQNMNDTFRQSIFIGNENNNQNSLTNQNQIYLEEAQQEQKTKSNIQACAESKQIIKKKALPKLNLANYSSKIIQEQQQEQI